MKILLSILLIVASLPMQAKSLPLDSAAWRAADLLDGGRWEQSVSEAEALWQRCEREQVTDTEIRLLVLQTLSEGLQLTGRTEQALAYTRILYHTAEQAGQEYEQEQIEALLDMSRQYAAIANIPEAMHNATEALDRMTAYVTRHMPVWVSQGDVEAIVMAEDVTFASLNALEDSYIAADEPHRAMLRDSLDLDGRISKMQTFCSTMDGMLQSAQGIRREALEAVSGLYRHLLCHTLLLAQRMQPEGSASLVKGRQYIEQVLRVTRKDEPAFIRATARMAVWHTLAGNYDSTLVWLNRLEQLDTDGSYRQVIEENKAWIAAVSNNWQTAMPLLRHRFTEKRKELVQDFYNMTAEARQHTWLSKYLWYFRQNINLCAGEDFPPDVHAFLYDNLLAEKGILLSTETEVLSLLRRQQGGGQLCDSLFALRKARQQVSNSSEAESYIERLQQLLNASHDLNALTRLLTLGYKDVQAGLREHDIAVEFVVSDDGNARQMYALVLRPKWEAPKLVRLGEYSTFVPLQQNRRNILNTEYTQRVWQPILTAGQITPGERIYFAPDGLFYLTGIEYMLVDSMHTMFDTYEMHRLSSTRELCQEAHHQSLHIQSDTTLLYGGVCYDADGTRSPVKYLPATLAEVGAIDSLLPHTVIRTCTDASEQSFKDLSAHSPRILHIATHGFYLPAPAAQQTKHDLMHSRLSSESIPNIEDYALSRSGLLLAGSGAAWGEQSYKLLNDGVLTAKEIAMLDLGQTDLVVLSACQTGLGDITVDGVAGLQRGFKKAGSGSMLLSLWPVNDAATKILMTEFYRNLAAGLTATQALQRAQFYLRTFTRDTAHSEDADLADVPPQRARPYLRSQQNRPDDDPYPYSSPYYWAAFVLLDAR